MNHPVRVRGSSWFGIARHIYIVLFVIFTALNKFIQVQFLPHALSSLLYNSFAIVGGLLLVVDFFTNRSMLKTKYSFLLVLFLIVCVLSCVVNAKYGIVDNAKTLVWTCIQVFLLMAFDTNTSRETVLKRLRVVAECFIALWLIGVLISFGQYLVQYHNVVSTSTDPACPVGFMGGRLFGIFTDPNVGATCSLLAIVLAWFLLAWDKKACVLRKIYYIVSIVFEFIYVILSGSRTGILCVFAVIFFAVVLFVREKTRTYHWHVALRSITAVVLAVVCVLGAYAGMALAKETLAYAPKGAAVVMSWFEGDFHNLPATQPSTGVTDPSGTDATLPPTVDFTRPDVEDSEDISNARFKIWKDCWELFKKAPLLGTSPRNHLTFAKDHFEDMYIVRKGYSVHNGYLAVMVCTGILGAIPVLLWMLLLVKTVLFYLFRKDASDPHYLPVAFLTAGLLVIAISAFLMMGIFFGNSVIELLFWFMVGNVLYLIRLAEPEKYAKEPMLYRLTEGVRNKLTKKN